MWPHSPHYGHHLQTRTMRLFPYKESAIHYHGSYGERRITCQFGRNLWPTFQSSCRRVTYRVEINLCFILPICSFIDHRRYLVTGQDFCQVSPRLAATALGKQPTALRNPIYHHRRMGQMNKYSLMNRPKISQSVIYGVG